MEQEPIKKIKLEASTGQPKVASANQTTTTFGTAPDSNTDTKEENKNVVVTEAKKFFSLNNVNILWFVLAAGLAIALKFLAKMLVAGTSVRFVWEEIITLCFALLIAGAYGSLSKKGKMAGAIVIFLILITASNLVRHDYGPERAEREAYLEMKERAKNIVVDENKVSYLLYDLGKTYVYNLEAGEETPWRGFQPDYLSKFGISSEKEYINGKRIEGEHTVYFSDGTSYNSKTTTTIPSKGKIFMKIKAHEKQTIYVTVM